MLIFKGSQVIKYYVMFAFLFVQTVYITVHVSYKIQCSLLAEIGINRTFSELSNRTSSFVLITPRKILWILPWCDSNFKMASYIDI